ncbi:MAG: GAF domain-containing protein [Desulfobacteraceae bacterium]|nr:GAF domain-containing protein [Desulfobacteraceae bacterium]
MSRKNTSGGNDGDQDKRLCPGPDKQELRKLKKKEAALEHQKTLLGGINRLLKEIPACENDEQVGVRCLAVAEEITGSWFGFIGKINPSGQFSTVAISNPGWDICSVSNPRQAIMEGEHKLRGIRGLVVKKEQSMIFNNPTAHPAWCGLPPGHPPVTCFMGVPLKLGEKTRGLIALANKPSGYTKADKEAVEALVEVFLESIERKHMEQDLQRSERALQVLRKVNHAVVHADHEQELMWEICRIFAETGGYPLAWVGLAQKDEARSVRPVAFAGPEKEYVRDLHITWADTETGPDPTGRSIRQGEPVICHDIHTNSALGPWRKKAASHGLAASLAIPLWIYGEVIGVLNLYASDSTAFNAREMEILIELANDLDHGMTNMRARAERDHSSAELKKSP